MPLWYILVSFQKYQFDQYPVNQYINYTLIWWGGCFIMRILKLNANKFNIYVSLTFVILIFLSIAAVFVWHKEMPLAIQLQISFFILFSGMGSVVIFMEDIFKCVAFLFYNNAFLRIQGIKEPQTEFNILQLLLIVESLQCAYGLTEFEKYKEQKRLSFYRILSKSDTALMLILCQTAFMVTAIMDCILNNRMY